MGALRQLFGRKHRESKGAAYKAIVQPVVSYCASLWILWQSTHLKRLEKLHKELTLAGKNYRLKIENVETNYFNQTNCRTCSGFYFSSRYLVESLLAKQSYCSSMGRPNALHGKHYR